MAEHIAKAEAQTAIPASVSAYMKAIGSKGGKVSGAKRMEMPEKIRLAVARKGAAARWGKNRPAKS
jgi:hypothetical protein